MSKSPILTDWAFYVNSCVPRLFFDQCSTVLISSDKKYQSKNLVMYAEFSG